MNVNDRNRAKVALLDKLKAENVFWSYDPDDISPESISDDRLIAEVMRHLDMDEIDLLLRVYPLAKVKKAWQRELLPEGPYLHTLNRFFAWYYFGIKNPDSYLKSMETRRLNRLSI